MVHFPTSAGLVRAVDFVSAVFESGKITGLIGESGCGKSVLGLALLGMIPPYANVKGSVFYKGLNIITAPPKELRRVRRYQIGLIPQSPGESLNPVRLVGSQLDEALRLMKHKPRGRREKALALLRGFGFEDPERIMRAYPFELSGGMQQRVLCAIGVSCMPHWILADEPTKGLDAELCGQVCENLLRLRHWGVNSMLIITHDLMLAEKICNVIAVMYAGEILELGVHVLKQPLHPYTRAFLASHPQQGMCPISGSPPPPGSQTMGCKFAPRCSSASLRCETSAPPMFQKDNTAVKCFLYA